MRKDKHFDETQRSKNLPAVSDAFDDRTPPAPAVLNPPVPDQPVPPHHGHSAPPKPVGERNFDGALHQDPASPVVPVVAPGPQPQPGQAAVAVPTAPPPRGAHVWERMGDSLYSLDTDQGGSYLIRIGETTYHHIGEHADGRWIYKNTKG